MSFFKDIRKVNIFDGIFTLNNNLPYKQNDEPARTFVQSLRLQGHDSRCAYRFSPDGKRIIHGCAIKRLSESYDGKRWRTNARLPGMKASSVRLSNNGERMISIHIKENRCTMTLWNTETGHTLYKRIEALLEDEAILQMSPDCLKVFASSTRTQILDIVEGRSVGSNVVDVRMSCAAFSLDGEKIVSVRSADGRVIVWETNTATISGPYTVNADVDDYVKSVAISPDGKQIALGFSKGRIALMEAETGTVSEKNFEGHKGIIQSLAFAADGNWIVSASSDMTVCVWDVATRDPICPPLRGHLGAVVLALFSPDGRSILSYGDDQTIRVWTLQ